MLVRERINRDVFEWSCFRWSAWCQLAGQHPPRGLFQPGVRKGKLPLKPEMGFPRLSPLFFFSLSLPTSPPLLFSLGIKKIQNLSEIKWIKAVPALEAELTAVQCPQAPHKQHCCLPGLGMLRSCFLLLRARSYLLSFQGVGVRAHRTSQFLKHFKHLNSRSLDIMT